MCTPGWVLSIGFDLPLVPNIGNIDNINGNSVTLLVTWETLVVTVVTLLVTLVTLVVTVVTLISLAPLVHLWGIPRGHVTVTINRYFL